MSVPLPNIARMLSPTGHWDTLRALAVKRAGPLTDPAAAGAGLCATCRAPVRGGYTRCFTCALHAETAPGLLADVVAPAAYARKGSQFARDLWMYKSGRPGAREAGQALLALLVVFLHDYGQRAWQRAGMAAPTHACVVPSCRGRQRPHPLQALASGYLTLPWVSLGTQPGADRWDRALDPDRFAAATPLPGAAVLLLDDTWTSGSSAQSAVIALKRAGARRVAAVVLGRHLGPPAGSDPAHGPRPRQ
jgi:hypothetical protein